MSRGRNYRPLVSLIRRVVEEDEATYYECRRCGGGSSAHIDRCDTCDSVDIAVYAF